ncbi:MAG: hypothetical protein ACK4MH_02480 [Brevundimonas sp.]|uniref:hypothetical protein n=1 Tax=Brevundimonas sp. TaxID=1871086 RepID=UPI00391B100A
MLRPISIFGFVVFCWLTASTAEACNYQVPRNPGETKAHAYERLSRTNQDTYWAEADTIFVGRVVALIQSDRGLEVRVEPRTSFKGDAGTGVIIYDHNWLEVSCDRAAFPDFDRVGIFYGSRENDRLAVRGMLGPNDIRDEALKARVIDQLDPGEVTTLWMETPRQDRLPLIIAGLIAFCAFIGGIGIGRLSRKRTAAQTGFPDVR